MSGAVKTLAFGALAPKLHKQLGQPQRRFRCLQDCADSIVTLAVGRILPESEVQRARERLVKRIAQVLSNFGGGKAGE